MKNKTGYTKAKDCTAEWYPKNVVVNEEGILSLVDFEFASFHNKGPWSDKMCYKKLTDVDSFAFYNQTEWILNLAVDHIYDTMRCDHGNEKAQFPTV